MGHPQEYQTVLVHGGSHGRYSSMAVVLLDTDPYNAMKTLTH